MLFSSPWMYNPLYNNSRYAAMYGDILSGIHKSYSDEQITIL